MTRKKLHARMLDKIEIVGNKLPHPATIFGIITLVVIMLSCIAYMLNLHAIHPVTGETITVNNLLSADGFRWMYTNI